MLKQHPDPVGFRGFFILWGITVVVWAIHLSSAVAAPPVGGGAVAAPPGGSATAAGASANKGKPALKATETQARQWCEYHQLNLSLQWNPGMVIWCVHDGEYKAQIRKTGLYPIMNGPLADRVRRDTGVQDCRRMGMVSSGINPATRTTLCTQSLEALMAAVRSLACAETGGQTPCREKESTYTR